MTDRGSRDRITPLDPVKPPRPAQVAPGSRDGAETDEQLRRSAVSALRKVGAQRGQTPASVYRPVPTLPPPSSDPETASKEALRRRAEEAEAKLAERERQDRVAAEIRSPNVFPPAAVPVSEVAPPAATIGPPGVQGRTGQQGAPASKLAQLPAILLGAAALVTAIATAVRPAPDTKAAESYAALRDELVKQNAALQKNGDNDELRWNFALGLFTAQGVKTTPQPGTPKVEPLVLEPAPLNHKVSPSSAPAIQVRDPLPPPVPSVAPVKLPKDLASLPAKEKP